MKKTKSKEHNLTKGDLLYEGKAKKVFATEKKNILLQVFKDDATAFNAKKKGAIANKGFINTAISAELFEFLEDKEIPTHFLGMVDNITMAVRSVEIVPLEVVVRNKVAGSLKTRTGLDEGVELNKPIVEFYYKNDELGDPLVTTEHIREMNLADPKELKILEKLARKINGHLKKHLHKKGLDLVDFKLEFGRVKDKGPSYHGIILADEISPDTCRLWDTQTQEKLDKDRFRFDLGKVEEGYQTVYNRITGKEI